MSIFRYILNFNKAYKKLNNLLKMKKCNYQKWYCSELYSCEYKGICEDKISYGDGFFCKRGLEEKLQEKDIEKKI